MALLFVVWASALCKVVVESLIGSISYLGCQHGLCLPFLNRANCWMRGVLAVEEREVKKDLVEAFIVACVPWTPCSELVWCRGDCDWCKWLFVDAQNDYGRYCIVWWNGHCWMEVSDTIPNKFCDSQQTAELFGVLKAIGLGLSLFGKEFLVVSDSVGSICSLCRLSMATKSWRRNQLLRKIVRDLLGKEYWIGCFWIASEFNPADKGTRMEGCVSRVEKVCEMEMESVFKEGVCLDKAQFFNRVSSG
jgi:hypothetical protein